MLNFSTNAYTRKNLEALQLCTTIAELALTTPFLINNDVNNTQLLSYLPFPASMAHSFVSASLETNCNLISSITRFAAAFKENSYSFPVRHFIGPILSRIANHIIMNNYPDQDQRINRRVIRTITYSMLFTVVNLPIIIKNPEPANNPLIHFLASIFVIGLAEYVGEQIIQGEKKKKIYHLPGSQDSVENMLKSGYLILE